MTSFNNRARNEASKYQHQISPKARHKFTFDCGANKEGGGGFQPGNTCGGDGDGKNTSGDQGGGDKASEAASTTTSSIEWESKGTNRKIYDDAFDEFMNTVEEINPNMHKAIVEEMDNMGNIPASALPDVLAGSWIEDEIYKGEAASTGAVWSTGTGLVELEISQEALDQGATIHNVDMSGIPDDLLREELEEYGFESDSDNMQDRESMEVALLTLLEEDWDNTRPLKNPGDEGYDIPDNDDYTVAQRVDEDTVYLQDKDNPDVYEMYVRRPYGVAGSSVDINDEEYEFISSTKELPS